MIELANASCGSGSCHAVWVEPETGDLCVVGDRTAVATADRPDEALVNGRTLTVRVDRPVYDQASAALARAARAIGIDRPTAALLPADLRSGTVYLEGLAVTALPEAIGVADHEAAVIVRRLDADMVEALDATV